MQAILQHLFKKNSLQEISVETLRQMTIEFPYFAVGQFLLTRKLLKSEDPSYEDQFQKTLICFHNPLWLQYKLSEPGTVEETVSDISEYIETEAAIAESTNETAQLPHDLIEEVVLNQENNYTNTDFQPIPSLEVPVEAHSIELTNGHQQNETQTIQREEPFIFQAYYTVDYFASQGIKLSQDNQQQDKLGKQLKSFTEWLKTMRRLPDTSAVEILHKINDNEIARIAAHSLEEKEVLTEAMAEVLIKQGKHEKARELYHKLSLQNPHKSPYFTAKIEDLKQH
jgi:hypothetical protein